MLQTSVSQDKTAALSLNDTANNDLCHRPLAHLNSQDMDTVHNFC